MLKNLLILQILLFSFIPTFSQVKNQVDAKFDSLTNVVKYLQSRNEFLLKETYSKDSLTKFYEPIFLEKLKALEFVYNNNWETFKWFVGILVAIVGFLSIFAVIRADRIARTTARDEFNTSFKAYAEEIKEMVNEARNNLIKIEAETETLRKISKDPDIEQLKNIITKK